METANHEYYVSLEVAKLLKEAGFKWLINTTYRDGVLMRQGNLLCDNFNGRQYENAVRHEFFSAPTLDVAQRWLREVKNCFIMIDVFVHNLDKNNIYCTYNWIVYLDDERYSSSNWDDTRYYEVAQEAGIEKALKLILEKVE